MNRGNAPRAASLLAFSGAGASEERSAVWLVEALQERDPRAVQWEVKSLK